MLKNNAAAFFSLIILLSLLGKASTHFNTVEQEQLTTAVNQFRQRVANGVHPAANMQQIYWDDQLAHMAEQDASKCECNVRRMNYKIGVTVSKLEKDKYSVQDLMENLLKNSETRPYVVKASFHQMGCAINKGSCGDSDSHELICYWYPRCGSIFNAYDEGQEKCWLYNSVQSNDYEGLCQLRDKFSSDSCKHSRKIDTSAIAKCKRRRMPKQLTCEPKTSTNKTEEVKPFQKKYVKTDIAEVFQNLSKKEEKSAAN